MAAETDRWHWTAHYWDGAALAEHEDGQERGWADVDQAQLVELDLLPAASGAPPAALRLEAGSSPVFFRRRAIRFDPNTGYQEHLAAVHVLGFDKDGVTARLFLYPDGTAVLMDHDPGQG